MILVTGAAGSVGRVLMDRLEQLDLDPIGHDIDTLDVTDPELVAFYMDIIRPKYVFHLAGAKHAPDGELDPWHVAQVNVGGTRNVLEHRGNAKVILASTCKACDPETAYGASKLIAERMVLNAGGVVCRFYNIPESDGNVFRYWESLPESEPIPYTDCFRYFSSMTSCVDLLTRAMALPSGRYAPVVGNPMGMAEVAEELYPLRMFVRVPRRRGDRWREPMHALSEKVLEVNGYLTITSPHDPAPAEAARSAA